MDKLNQKKYICPYCGHTMTISSCYTIKCTNTVCDFADIGWNIRKLESFPCNKAQRLEEVINDEE